MEHASKRVLGPAIPGVSKNAVLIVATLATFVTPFSMSSVNIALPAIGAEFRMDAILMGWVTTSFLLSSAAFLVIFGRLADIHGRKRIFTYGIVIFAAASFLISLSPSPEILILMRVVQGVGGSMIATTSVALITSVFPPGERGKALGINSAAVYTGLSAGPFLGGMITQYLGWRAIFLLIVPLMAIVLLLASTSIRGEWMEAKGESFDLAGSAIYGFMLVSTVYGFSSLPSHTGWILLAAGLVGLFAFIRYESSAKSPVLDMRLFRGNRIFTYSNVTALINYASTSAITFLMSLYLQYVRGLDPQGAGLVLLAQPVVQAVVSPLSGRLSDRVEPRLISSAGMAIISAGLLALSAISAETPQPLIVANLAALGFGFALFITPNTNAIMSSVEKKFLGVASGTLATMRQVGQTLSMGFAMMVLAVYVGPVQITPPLYPAFMGSLTAIFVFFALLCLVGMAASLARGEVGVNSKQGGQGTALPTGAQKPG
ncbi:MAG: MFS transporter [Candidatus Methanosuratincola sp.]|jgi:EmrB/QacA subfamily drug resistance transporter|nr:MFS transporter [Candidatus Methanosuratincola sp.]